MAGNAEKNRPFEESPGELPGYAPTRPVRLRSEEQTPPPLPVNDASDFGGADEDGLYMLAALETLTSLEPDYAYDVAAEASVTVVECADEDVVYEALAAERRGPPPPRRPIGSDMPALLLNGYENFSGAGDEAEIEIVEIVHTFEAPEEVGEGRAVTKSLTGRLATARRVRPGSRFLKALSGDD